MSNKNLSPTLFAIFGGSGDLAWRKLIPSLFNLFQDGNMPDKFVIIALDRKEINDNALRSHFIDGIQKFSRKELINKEGSKQFSEHIFHLKGDFTKDEVYSALKKQGTKFEKDWNSRIQYIFYMATPPAMFAEIPEHLVKNGLADDKDKARIVVEKPIGCDLPSSMELNKILNNSFSESQIFRIDHYLGKETVQNILAFRFANPLFEPIWNRSFVDYVTITVAEEIGIGHRGSYYEKAGALRDMIQNHVMQLLCLVAMEPMVSFNADEIRNKKVDVLHAIRPIPDDLVHEFAVRGQYEKGYINGEEVCGYRQEGDVAPDSVTETFVALKLFVDNWRWQDVPFYVRTGKRMPRQASEISVRFRKVPHQSFPLEAALDWKPSSLIISIQPDEGIILQFQAKQPGTKLLLQPVIMRFSYNESFSLPIPDAYETLLWDVMNSDATLFMRADQVEASWKIITPILDAWSGKQPVDFPNYKAGTWGPEAANGLLDRGHLWPLPTELVQK